MAIVRWWDPWRDMSTLQERVNQLFEDASPAGRGREEAPGSALWSPSVDIYETDEAVVMKAEIPGVAKDQVSVEVKDGLLTLRGERKFEKEVKEENYHRVERSYGSFQRSFTLPTSVDQEKIGASLVDGVLEVRLPKRKVAKPKQIQVKVD